MRFHDGFDLLGTTPVVSTVPHTAPPAFEALYEAEFAYVWHSLRRLGIAPRDLEDLAQETFVTAYGALASYDPARPLRPWLFGIAYRVASNFRRRAHHTREVSDVAADAPHEAPGVDEAIGDAQDRQLVHAAVQAIEEARRPVFVMHELHGHSVPDIADALGLPLNTAYSRLRLARGEFAQAVERLRLRRGDR